MSVEFNSINDLLDGMDFSKLLPEIGSIVDWVRLLCRIAILVGPLVLLLAGLSYLFLAPKEANHYLGYRTAFGMGSVAAWRHTQKIAGWMFAGVGLVLEIIMLMICITFTGLAPMAAVGRAVKCLIWQAVLSALVVLSVNSVAAFTFDYKGNRRRK